MGARLGIFLLVLLLSSIAVVHQYRRYTYNTDSSIVRIKKQPILEYDRLHLKIKSFRQKTSILRPIQIHETSDHTELLEQRRQSVKAAFLHGWQGYKKYAFGFDELKPLTNRSHNPFGGLGATIIDSLSTMLVMDLQDEVQQLLPWTESLNVTVNVPISVFETTIRCMGGLLSAYELSQQEVFLKKAEEIGQALLPAFDTPFGIPYYHFNPHK